MRMRRAAAPSLRDRRPGLTSAQTRKPMSVFGVGATGDSHETTALHASSPATQDPRCRILDILSSEEGSEQSNAVAQLPPSNERGPRDMKRGEKVTKIIIAAVWRICRA